MPSEGIDTPWRARARHALLGPGRQSRLTITHCLHSAAEATLTVSLAGSIFFSVSPDAARPRVLLFLVLTLAPFLVMAPLIGPVVDRLRGGLATTMITTFVIRAVLALAIATNLRSLLLFPLVFGVLVVAKTYTVSRNALVPSIAEPDDDLVAFNARLSRTATIAGTISAGVAVAVFGWTSASVTLVLAAVLYVAGAIAAWRVRQVSRRIEPIDVEAIVELVQPDVGGAVWDMMALRAAVGFAIFQFGFSLRAEGEPAWMIGLVLGANAIGGFTGTVVSPFLSRRTSERSMLTLALIVSSLAMTASGLVHRQSTLVGAVFLLGLSASVGRRALDATIQRQAPNARRGQVYAGLETRLELAWVAAACLAVALRVATWIGVLALAAFLVVMTLVHLRRGSGLAVLRPVRTTPLQDRLLLRAETLANHGFHDEAVLVARLARTVTDEDTEAATADEAHREIERTRAARFSPHDGARPDAPEPAAQRTTEERRSDPQEGVAAPDVGEVVDRVVDEVPAERLDREP